LVLLSSTTDQITTFNGAANAAIQKGFLNVDVSGVTGNFGAQIAANAAGFSGQWITEWYAFDKQVCAALGLKAAERVAGFVYIGTAREKPEERDREEFEKELDDSKTIAETMNITAGSVQSTIVGGSDAPLAQQTKVELEQVVREPDVQIKLVDATLPGLDRLGDDLGEAEVTGEVGALVEGYGAALDRLTQELLT